MADVTDPRFPDRPQHDDFWSIVEIVQDMDAVSDSHTMQFTDHVAQTVDPESLSYMSQERGKLAIQVNNSRMVRNLTAAQRTELHALLAATWLEAFLVGARFQAKRGLPEVKDFIHDTMEDPDGS